MSGGLCDAPGGGHDGAPRLYPCGRLCTAHAPQARPTVAPTTTVPSPGRAASRRAPALDRRRVTGALFIDLGEGRETKAGWNAGQIRYSREPAARYECVACNWRSEIVTGAAAVQRFTDHIRTTHQAACPAAATQQGAPAA